MNLYLPSFLVKRKLLNPFIIFFLFSFHLRLENKMSVHRNIVKPVKKTGRIQIFRALHPTKSYGKEGRPSKTHRQSANLYPEPSAKERHANPDHPGCMLGIWQKKNCTRLKEHSLMRFQETRRLQSGDPGDDGLLRKENTIKQRKAILAVTPSQGIPPLEHHSGLWVKVEH